METFDIKDLKKKKEKKAEEKAEEIIKAAEINPTDTKLEITTIYINKKTKEKYQKTFGKGKNKVNISQLTNLAMELFMENENIRKAFMKKFTENILKQ